ncbi:TetR/AcrR family transcriptional regulator [Gordonia sp. i37]|uniref:TetR/AcrR family transcriptional regulator n=1 Tax=Gordonia sp. i37 TaxID=1961707 RepID=UPI0009CEA78F|nr:TetR/AcrR family transcriptional regulator [Gordonia sp. i37]OPX13482.1 hypothetical protein B1964_20035 [Gordonia sp. i37]
MDEKASLGTDAPAPPRRRGRPPTLDRARIITAGVEMTLPAVTFAGMAKQLGVTQAALYKHVDGLGELRTLIAEQIFLDWSIPDPHAALPIHEYLLDFALSIRLLAHHHPGITPFLTRRTDTTATMVAKIGAHHHRVAAVYGLDPATARTLLSGIAFAAVALADTVYASYDQEKRPSSARADLPDDDIETELRWTVKALVVGSLHVAGLDVDPGPRWRRT